MLLHCVAFPVFGMNDACHVVVSWFLSSHLFIFIYHGKVSLCLIVCKYALHSVYMISSPPLPLISRGRAELKSSKVYNMQKKVHFQGSIFKSQRYFIFRLFACYFQHRVTLTRFPKTSTILSLRFQICGFQRLGLVVAFQTSMLATNISGK